MKYEYIVVLAYIDKQETPRVHSTYPATTLEIAKKTAINLVKVMQPDKASPPLDDDMAKAVKKAFNVGNREWCQSDGSFYDSDYEQRLTDLCGFLPEDEVAYTVRICRVPKR